MFVNYRNQGSIDNACRIMPVIYFSLMMTMFLLLGVDAVSGWPSNYLANITQQTILKYQLWRVLFPFLSDGLISVLVGLLGLYFLLPDYERRYSSTFTIIDLLMQNFILQMVICVLSMIGYALNMGMATSKGLWGLWMIYIVRWCLEDPDAQSRIMCLPCTINRKYLPIFILLIITLLMGFRLDIFVAIGLGYLQGWYCKGYLIKLNINTVRRIEYLLPNSLKARTDFYKVQQCSGELMKVCKVSLMDVSSSQGYRAQIAPAVILGTGIAVDPGNRQPVTIDDVRDHWANKDEDGSNSSEGSSGMGASSVMSEGNNLIR